MKNTVKIGLILAFLAVFSADLTAQPYIRVYNEINGQLYGQLEDYVNDTAEVCAESLNLTANDTLYQANCTNQLITVGATHYILFLDTVGTNEGKIFKIKNNNSAVLAYYFEIYSGNGTKLDEVFPNDVKYYIYIGGAWRAYAIGTGDGTSLQAISIGKLTRSLPGGVAVGYDARAQTNGVAIGWGSDGYTSGIAIGYRAYGYGSGVGIGYSASGYTKGTAIGRETIAANRGVAVGYQSRANNDGVAIGHQAGANNTSDYKLYIDNTNTTTPLIYGEFDNDYIKINDSLAINNLTGSGNRLVLAGSGGQLIAGDTVTAYSMPSGTLSQTLRHNGTAWVANDILKINDTPSLTFTGSGGVERFKVEPSGTINSSTLVGVGTRNLVCNSSGNIEAGFGSYSVAEYLEISDTTTSILLSNSALSFTVSSNEKYVFDITLGIIKSDTAQQNIILTIDKGSGGLTGCFASGDVTIFDYTDSRFIRSDLPGAQDFTGQIAVNLISGNTLPTIIKLRGVIINDGNAGTVYLKFAKGDILNTDVILGIYSNLTAIKSQ